MLMQMLMVMWTTICLNGSLTELTNTLSDSDRCESQHSQGAEFHSYTLTRPDHKQLHTVHALLTQMPTHTKGLDFSWFLVHTAALNTLNTL